MRIPSRILFCLLAFVSMGLAETHAARLAPLSPLLQNGNARIVLVGDSITGQSRNHPAGYAYQIEWALEQAYPGCHPNVVSLGGSGQGVQAWLNTEKRSRADAFPLDVKGIEVKAALDQPADVLIVMLGMNDVLAPYVVDDPASLDKWVANYRELVIRLQIRSNPKVTAVATPTLCTEDLLHSPKNAMMDQLNKRLTDLAEEMQWRVLPTNHAMREVLARGRELKADFHVTHDYVHPNEAGHIAIAMGMLRGLGETTASHALEEQKLAKIFDKAKGTSATASVPSAPWLVATGIIRKPWNERQPLDPAGYRGPIEEAIEHRGDFVAAPDPATGKPLEWKPYAATVDYTGGANPDSVDFAAVTHARNFEAGYAARWIHSERERPVNIELSTQTFASTMQIGLWLNGGSLYAGLLTGEPGKKKTVAAQLHAGWNTLVFALNHTAWQMQCTVHLAGIGDDTLADLRDAISPQKDGR
ncbi:MAG: GDSL-type esterase/lipase family protein [Chthoniobacter sp.]|uniref:GDSL-type esterase/lipase family protein n=1 Tax=Chthoniobacter sp. TaxID=2510640 RepID=UPI0032A9E69D